MSKGFGWNARWKDPLTGLPTGIARDGFASAQDAQADALRHAPAIAEIAIHAPDGSTVEFIPRRADDPNLDAP